MTFPRVVILATLVACLTAGMATVAKSVEPPQIEAKSWFLIDARTGETLAGKAPNRRLPMASTTKMMTALLAARRLRLDRTVRAAPYNASPGESLMGLQAGQKVSVRDLLYGLLLLSGNDAAITLAVAVAGTVPRFVGLMNQAARQIGLENTSYENPIGLDGARQYSSAGDLVALSQILMSNPTLRKIAGTRSATLTSYQPPLEIETGNEFVRDVPWAKGVKTGYTSLADYVLASVGRRKATELTAAVMGASSEAMRDAETVKLMDYGFSLYDKRVPVRPKVPVTRVPVRFENEDLSVSAQVPVRVGVRKGDSLKVTFDLPDEVEGPLARGDRIGSASVLVDGETIRKVGLFADRNVAEPGPIERALGLLLSNLVYLGVALLVILGLALLFRRRQERKMKSRLIRAGKRRR